MTKRWIHRLGWAGIALLWTTTGYLVAYYSVLLVMGPDRLYRWLGQTAYNALIPVGGFSLLLMAAVSSVCWIAPFLTAFAVVRLTLGRLSRLSSPWVPLAARGES